MKIASYVRCSTDSQDREKQHNTIRDWCTRRGYGPPDTYEEVGRRYEGLNRPELKKLMAKADQYDTIVVENLDRVGFRDALQLMHILYLLDQEDCRLWLAATDTEVRSDNIGGMVQNVVAGETSKQELVTKARRVLTKARDHGKEGKFLGGPTPYALDLCCWVGEELRWRAVLVGRKTWEVGGQKYEGYLPARPPGSFLRWLPSEDPLKLQTVRAIFEQAADDQPIFRIAASLNHAGVKHPLGPWYSNYIKRMILNPAYTGRPTWNRTSRATYGQYRGGQVHEDVNRHKDDRRNLPTDPHDHLAPDRPVYQPLVSQELFDQANARFRQPAGTPRRPRSPDLWLAGLLSCSCGALMVGLHAKSRGKEQKPAYCCGAYNTYGRHNPASCGHNRVRHEVVEAIIDKYLEQIGATLEPLTGPPEGILALLESQASSARSELRSVYEDMRAYAVEALGEPGEGLSLSDLHEAVSLAENARRGPGRARRGELEAELRCLVKTWQEIPGEYAKRVAQEEIARVETELRSLDDQPEFCKRVRELSVRLTGVYRSVSRARAEADPLAKSRILRGLLERIELHFGYKELRGGRRQAVLERVEFHPLRGEAWTSHVAVTNGRVASPPR